VLRFIIKNNNLSINNKFLLKVVFNKGINLNILRNKKSYKIYITLIKNITYIILKVI
jgi:hypothetical protein